MKTLKKISLHNVEDIMQDSEMKKILGGYNEHPKDDCLDLAGVLCNGTPECSVIVGENLKVGHCYLTNVYLDGITKHLCLCSI